MLEPREGFSSLITLNRKSKKKEKESISLFITQTPMNQMNRRVTPAFRMFLFLPLVTSSLNFRSGHLQSSLGKNGAGSSVSTHVYPGCEGNECSYWTSRKHPSQSLGPRSAEDCKWTHPPAAWWKWWYKITGHVVIVCFSYWVFLDSQHLGLLHRLCSFWSVTMNNVLSNTKVDFALCL